MSTTTEIRSFFKESDSNLGIFYPTHYILAALPDYETAVRAEQAMRSYGLPEDQTLALDGGEMVRFLEEFRREEGVKGRVMTGVSRLLGDDATFVDDDMERAKQGAGFLFVYCATSEEAQRLKTALTAFEPKAMRWYMNEGIQDLI